VIYVHLLARGLFVYCLLIGTPPPPDVRCLISQNCVVLYFWCSGIFGSCRERFLL
jgi:hypothetical protein